MNAEIGLLQPYWLLLLPLPLVWLAWRRKRRQPWPVLLPPMTLRFPLLGVVHDSQRPEARARSVLGERLIAAALLLAVIALAQPVRYVGIIEPTETSESVDLVIVASTAISMVLRDYMVDGERVDRMTMTRRLLDRFVADFQGRRIGLVVLGNPPALWLPLTPDKRVVRDAIARLRTVMIGRLSDTGAALKLVNDEFSDTADKVVVMLTDGGLQLGETSPLAAARALVAGGNTLYIIGMGASEPGEYAGDVGGLIYEPIDPVGLTEVAQAGGGRFFHATDTDAFKTALSVIESSHRKPVAPAPAQRQVEPWYPLPLGVAMLLILIAGLYSPSARAHGEEQGG